jgi:D-3-phosphoglycerate dehydrogenase
MKPEAYLVNTGAAPALDHDALVDALRERRIAGAALDVFPGHPLPPTSPLLTLDNVVLTPHIGGSTEETVERHSRMIAGDIERFFAGKRPRHVVNPEARRRAGAGSRR